MNKQICALILVAAISAHALYTDFEGLGFHKSTFSCTKDGWISGYQGEQLGNYSDMNFGFYRFNGSHFLLMDFDISTIPAFDDIIGVQIAIRHDNPWPPAGIQGIRYNCIKSDSDWSQGTRQDFQVLAPAGEPNYTCARIPETPWKQGCANLLALVSIGSATLPTDGGESGTDIGEGVYDIVINLNKTILRDFLEGNAHGICFWGGEPFYIYKLYQLWVFTRQDRIEGDAHPAINEKELSVFPNPGKPCFTIHYSGNSAYAEIMIFDLAGKHVASLMPNEGTAIWDGTDMKGRMVKSAVYIFEYRGLSETGEIRKHGKLMLMR